MTILWLRRHGMALGYSWAQTCLYTENYQKDVPFKILASPKTKFAEYDIHHQNCLNHAKFTEETANHLAMPPKKMPIHLPFFNGPAAHLIITSPQVELEKPTC